jgi:thiamine-monophosphate kinase
VLRACLLYEWTGEMRLHVKLDVDGRRSSLQETTQNAFMNTRNTSENELVRRIRAIGTTTSRLNSAVRLGIGDDAALFSPQPDYETILTCDWFLEGTHFLRDKHPADSVGWKCLARAVSDIAAMGGEPRCFLLSLALPKTHTTGWLNEFLAGLRRAARKFKCPLAGGDTTRRDEILMNVTVVGEVRSVSALLRSGARPGDIIYVSGRLGEAELGLRRLRSRRRIAKGDARLRKHLYPEPRVALGLWLSQNGTATSMMDLSDGLSTDLTRLCAASGVGARLEASRIPTASKPQRFGVKNVDALDLALNGGDDYELLFTVRPSKTNRVPCTLQGVPLTAIGEIKRGRRLKIVQLEGHETEMRSSGWDPF